MTDLFKDANGEPIKESIIIVHDGFELGYFIEPYLKEVRFVVNGLCVAEADFYGSEPSYTIGDTDELSEVCYSATEAQFVSFIFDNYSVIAEWLLFNLGN